MSAWRTAALSALGTVVVLSSCNGGGSSGEGMIGVVGEELPKPDGAGTFFNEANEGGAAGALYIEDILWGRLVDIHDVDASGEINATPVFRDMVINETIQTDGGDYRLETNPVTLKTRLVVRRTKGADDTGAGTFHELLRLATEGLSPVLPKSDTPGTPGPFSFVARNAVLSVRFNDLLLDDEEAASKLGEHIRVKTNYPPTVPYLADRILFDTNHGGLSVSGGVESFHSTRVLIDMTVSETEAASGGVGFVGSVGALGLPSSLVTTNDANVSVRFPTKIDTGSAQFSVLANLVGHGLSTSGNGPVDFSSDTLDVVRAMRSGNPEDTNNGFLLDLDPPQLLGAWSANIDAAQDQPGGEVGFDFRIDFTFETPCRSQPNEGDILQLPGLFLEVVADGGEPDATGQVQDLSVRSLGLAPAAPAELLGGGLYQRPYETALLPLALEGCWVSFDPLPGVVPSTIVDPAASISLRFSEPMDPGTVLPFDSFLVTNKDTEPTPHDIVVGGIQHSADARIYDFTPAVSFDHSSGSEESFYVQLVGGDGGMSDLAGNAPVVLPDVFSFRLDPSAPTARAGGLVLRFDKADELISPAAAAGPSDLVGQFLYDFERELIRPRPLVRSSLVADRSQVVPNLMIAFAQGVQTPLSPLGSRMMTVWRYLDLGLSVTDSAGFDIDVEGVNWSPIAGNVSSDYYPEFEMRLAHSHFLPEESLDAMGALARPSSGLVISSFDANIHPDPSASKTVHDISLGYTVNPSDIFLSSTGTVLMPYPLNRGLDPSKYVHYTWRDTTIRERGGPFGLGIPTGIEEATSITPTGSTGTIATPTQVPTIGLPLLMEFRCYPTEEGLGFNAFDISLAVNGSRQPNFRVFSTGGYDEQSTKKVKDPDLLSEPDGGFNPGSVPAGMKTPPDDNTFYIGQLDVITRVSRVHTVWMDMGVAGTTFLDPVLEPASALQPQGTQVLVAWRGASAILGDSLTDFAFDSAHIDPYGDVRPDDGMSPPAPVFMGGTGDLVLQPVGDDSWKDSLHEVDGARYLQARITFLGNPSTLLSAELSSLAVAFTWE